MKRAILAGFTALLLVSDCALFAQSLRESRRVFLRARSAIADGRYREALELYRKVLQELPDDAIVHYEYAQLLRDLNVLDEASQEARQAVRLDPQLAEARRLLGALELQAAEEDPSRLDAAIEQLDAARRLRPDDIQTSVALGRALMARGRPGEAARVFDELPEGRTQPGIIRLAAEAQAASGRYKDAEENWLTLRRLDPSNREITAALIDLYEEQDRLDEALALLSELERADPSNTAVAERITLDLARAGRFADAEAKARELAAKRPENRAIRRLLATVLAEKGDAAGGEKILRDLIAEDPEDDATRRTLAGELLRERRFADGRAVLEELDRRASASGRPEPKAAAQVELGYLAFLEKNYAEARRILEPIAIQKGDVHPRAMRILLAAARETEGFDWGRKNATAAAQADPAEPEWPAARAEFEWRSGEKAKGEETLRALATADDPDRTLAAADAWGRMKDYAASAKIARDATRRFPESSDALFRLGSSLERSGDFAGAERAFQDLLKMRPRDAPTQNYLGYMWADKGVRLEEARALLEKAVAREPRNGAYQDSLGWLYFRLGRLEEAARHLQEARRLEPDDPVIEEHLGDLAERRGDLTQAIAHWERALSLDHEEPETVRPRLERARARSAAR
jgi:tetratricopeptide (TPR) repeat protein